LENTDIFMLKADGIALEVGLVELGFRVKQPAQSEAVGLLATQPYSKLGIGDETGLAVTELTDSGVFQAPSLPVVWQSDQPDVVAVENGRATGLKPGVAIVRANMGSVRAEMIVEVRPDGMAMGQAADPYRWTALERLSQFALKEANTPYRYVGLRLREPVMPVPIIHQPQQEVQTNSRNFTITGTSAAGSRVQIWLDRNGNGWLDDEDTFVGERQLGSGETAFAIKLHFEGEGAWRYLVTGANRIGERSAETALPVLNYVRGSAGACGHNQSQGKGRGGCSFGLDP